MNYGAGPRKLPFTIRSCSGEDPDYPARQLLLHSTDTRGWQTPQHCSYPQEIVLQLDKQARLQQLQILSHESNISSRIEIYSSSLPLGETDISRAVETRLGFTTFGNNEASGYQARELKSVSLQNFPAILVRLVVHRCHVNKRNIWNQVGLVALNLIGTLAHATLQSFELCDSIQRKCSTGS
jgi:centrosomal protein CEP104